MVPLVQLELGLGALDKSHHACCFTDQHSIKPVLLPTAPISLMPSLQYPRCNIHEDKFVIRDALKHCTEYVRCP